MELSKAVRHTFNVDVKQHNLYTIAGYTQDGTLRVAFTPTVAKVDVKITRGTAEGEIECSMNEPLRPIKTEYDASDEMFRDIKFSAYYEGDAEQVKLATLNSSTGDLELHPGTTELVGYIAVYR